MASDKGVPSIILLIGERHLTMPFLDELLFQFLTQVNRMFRSRRVLAIGGKYCDYGWTGSVFIHFYFLLKVSWRRKQQTGCFYIE